MKKRKRRAVLFQRAFKRNTDELPPSYQPPKFGHGTWRQRKRKRLLASKDWVEIDHRAFPLDSYPKGDVTPYLGSAPHYGQTAGWGCECGGCECGGCGGCECGGTETGSGGSTETGTGGATETGTGGTTETGTGGSTEIGAGGSTEIGAGGSTEIGAGGSTEIGAGGGTAEFGGGTAEFGGGTAEFGGGTAEFGGGTAEFGGGTAEFGGGFGAEFGGSGGFGAEFGGSGGYGAELGGGYEFGSFGGAPDYGAPDPGAPPSGPQAEEEDMPAQATLAVGQLAPGMPGQTAQQAANQAALNALGPAPMGMGQTPEQASVIAGAIANNPAAANLAAQGMLTAATQEAFGPLGSFGQTLGPGAFSAPQSPGGFPPSSIDFPRPDVSAAEFGPTAQTVGLDFATTPFGQDTQGQGEDISAPTAVALGFEPTQGAGSEFTAPTQLASTDFAPPDTGFSLAPSTEGTPVSGGGFTGGGVYGGDFNLPSNIGADTGSALAGLFGNLAGGDYYGGGQQYAAAVPTDTMTGVSPFGGQPQSQADLTASNVYYGGPGSMAFMGGGAGPQITDQAAASREISAYNAPPAGVEPTTTEPVAAPTADTITLPTVTVSSEPTTPVAAPEPAAGGGENIPGGADTTPDVSAQAQQAAPSGTTAAMTPDQTAAYEKGASDALGVAGLGAQAPDYGVPGLLDLMGNTIPSISAAPLAAPSEPFSLPSWLTDPWGVDFASRGLTPGAAAPTADELGAGMGRPAGAAEPPTTSPLDPYMLQQMNLPEQTPVIYPNDPNAPIILPSDVREMTRDRGSVLSQMGTTIPPIENQPLERINPPSGNIEDRRAAGAMEAETVRDLQNEAFYDYLLGRVGLPQLGPTGEPSNVDPNLPGPREPEPGGPPFVSPAAAGELDQPRILESPAGPLILPSDMPTVLQQMGTSIPTIGNEPLPDIAPAPPESGAPLNPAQPGSIGDILAAAFGISPAAAAGALTGEYEPGMGTSVYAPTGTVAPALSFEGRGAFNQSYAPFAPTAAGEPTIDEYGGRGPGYDPRQEAIISDAGPRGAAEPTVDELGGGIGQQQIADAAREAARGASEVIPTLPTENPNLTPAERIAQGNQFPDLNAPGGRAYDTGLPGGVYTGTTIATEPTITDLIGDQFIPGVDPRAGEFMFAPPGAYGPAQQGFTGVPALPGIAGTMAAPPFDQNLNPPGQPTAPPPGEFTPGPTGIVVPDGVPPYQAGEGRGVAAGGAYDWNAPGYPLPGGIAAPGDVRSLGTIDPIEASQLMFDPTMMGPPQIFGAPYMQPPDIRGIPEPPYQAGEGRGIAAGGPYGESIYGPNFARTLDELRQGARVADEFVPLPRERPPEAPGVTSRVPTDQPPYAGRAVYEPPAAQQRTAERAAERAVSAAERTPYYAPAPQYGSPYSGYPYGYPLGYPFMIQQPFGGQFFGGYPYGGQPFDVAGIAYSLGLQAPYLGPLAGPPMSYDQAFSALQALRGQAATGDSAAINALNMLAPALQGGPNIGGMW